MIQPQPPLILHVIHHLVMGGMETGLVNLINRLPETRFRHAIACVEDYSDFRDRIQRKDVEVVAMHRSRIGTWGLRKAIFDLCRRLKPTIVHSRNMSGLDAILPAYFAGVRHRVHGEHGWDVNDLDGIGFKPALLRRLHAPFVERYVTVSTHLEDYLVERVKVPRSKITQIYNGVDTRRFEPRNASSVSALPLGFTDRDSIVLGTVGRIQPVKDQATLVRAFADLLRSNREMARRARLVVIGDGPLLSNLRKLVETLDIASSVWLPGSLSNVPDLLRSFDVFVLPSLSEGISNTILEAMATGLPVLATRAGGNVELVEEGATGRLFAPGDVEGLVSLLGELVTNDPLRQRMAVSARQVSIQRFGIERMIEQYEATYESLIRRPHRPTDQYTRDIN
jgi:sugar transferase (PEP-CTERM/EpsH1 system associated)